LCGGGARASCVGHAPPSGFRAEHAIELALLALGLASAEAGLYATAVYFEVCYFLKFVTSGVYDLQRYFIETSTRCPRR